MPRMQRSQHRNPRSTASSSSSAATMSPKSSTATPARELVDSLALTDAQLTDIYYKMLVSRTVSARMRLLQRMGKGSITYSAEGHEAAQVGTTFALRPGTDWLYTYYRDAGVAITIGMTAYDVLMAFFARRDDPNSGGRNMPNHFSSKELRIVSQGAPVATQVPQAVGTALAVQASRPRRGHRRPLRRRRNQRRRRPRGDELRRHPRPARSSSSASSTATRSPSTGATRPLSRTWPSAPRATASPASR